MAEPNEPLTERELQIVQALATGASNKEIAAQLFLSPNTVKVHLRNIFTKLEVQTRTEATMIAVRNGWVAVGSAAGSNGTVGEAVEPAEVSKSEVAPPSPSFVAASDNNTSPIEDATAPATDADVHPPSQRQSDVSAPGVADLAETKTRTIPLERLNEINLAARTTMAPILPAITPVPVAPNPQLLPPLSMRRRLALVGALILAVALSVLSLQIRPTDATSNVEDLNNSEVQGGVAFAASQSTRWNTRASVRSARARSIAVGVPAQNEIVLIGGEVDRRLSGEVLVYNRNEDAWHDLSADKPTPVVNTGAALLGSRIYVPGGTAAQNRPTNLFEVLDLQTRTWTALPNLPKPATGLAVAGDDQQVFVMGGRVDGQITGESLAFDVETGQWSPLPSMPTPRENAAAATFNDRIYVVGGSDGRRELPTCEFYSIRNKTWSPCAAMTVGRSNFGLVTVGPALYAVGGGAVNFIGWNEKYDPATDKWTTFETPATHTGDWRQIAVAAFPTEFYVMGGRTRNVPLSDMYVYEVLSNRTFLPAFQSDGK